MLQKIKSGLLCSAILLSFNTWAVPQGNISLVAGQFHPELAARQERLVVNFLTTKVTAVCEVTTEKDLLANVQITLVKIGRSPCKINEFTLDNDNSSVVLPMQTGQKLSLAVDVGTIVNLANQSDSTIKLDCTVDW